jgi:hypothetical protein
MAFTEAERRQWHADRRAGRDSDGYSEDVRSTCCAHCGIRLGSNYDSEEFPLCDACDD